MIPKSDMVCSTSTFPIVSSLVLSSAVECVLDTVMPVPEEESSSRNPIEWPVVCTTFPIYATAFPTVISLTE